MTDFTNLLQGRAVCECGKNHSCSISNVYIGSGAVGILPELVVAYQNAILVADENTYDVQGNAVERLLGDRVQSELIYSGASLLVPDEDSVQALQEMVTKETDLIIGVGAGVINDICKYVSFCCDLPYFIVATAPSMDGYASNGAAMIFGGMKISPNTRPPVAIIGDTRVLRAAPIEMIQAGYGDIMGKLSCLNDWKLSSVINHEYFCHYVYDLTYKTVMDLIPLSEALLMRDEHAVGVLMEALVKVGIAMSYVGNSRPASGSEHHLSHFFEITGIVHNRPYLPHGIDVAYSSILTAILRQKILADEPEHCEFNRDDWERSIRQIYGSVAQSVIELQDKQDSYRIYAENTLAANRQEIINCLLEAPTPEQMLQIINNIGLEWKFFEDFYGEHVLQDAVCWAKDLKDRYTVLWLYNQFFGK